MSNNKSKQQVDSLVDAEQWICRVMDFLRGMQYVDCENKSISESVRFIENARDIIARVRMGISVDDHDEVKP